MAMTHKDTLRHVVRAPEVYLIPRSDGRVVIGATVEEAGFNKQTVPATILRLHEAALKLAPELRNGKILEAWAGLRPGTPDDLTDPGSNRCAGIFHCERPLPRWNSARTDYGKAHGPGD